GIEDLVDWPGNSVRSEKASGRKQFFGDPVGRNGEVAQKSAPRPKQPSVAQAGNLEKPLTAWNFTPIPYPLLSTPGTSVTHLLLTMFPAFLGVEAEGGDRAGIETIEADVFVGFLAEAVATFL